MNKSVIIIVAILFIVFGFWFYNSKSDSGEGPVAEAANLGPLTLSEANFDFGRITMSGGKVSKVFEISNQTGGDVMLSKVTTSCMCTVAYLLNGSEKKGPFGMPGHGGPVRAANELIKEGETREVEVVFDPNAHGPAGVGLIERAIYFEDSSGRIAEFRFKGLVTP